VSAVYFLSMHRRSWSGPFLPFPNASSVRSLVGALRASNRSALAYMSQWFHGGRNVTEYVDHITQWRDAFGEKGKRTPLFLLVLFLLLLDD
jgi:hypothetical protein